MVPVPVIPNIHQRVYEAVSRPGALDMDYWHTCETTHCRAGWVIHLAGDDGTRLETLHGPRQAARMIYAASSPIRVNLLRFLDTNEVAMADMKYMAKLERSQQVTT